MELVISDISKNREEGDLVPDLVTEVRADWPHEDDAGGEEGGQEHYLGLVVRKMMWMWSWSEVDRNWLSDGPFTEIASQTDQ